MKKKSICFVLLLSMILGLGGNAAFAATVADTFDFDESNSITGWNIVGDASGTVSIVDGELQMVNTNQNAEFGAVNCNDTYANFVAEFTYRFVAGANNDAAMFLYRASENASTGYAVYFVHCPDEANQYYIKFTSRPYTSLQEGLFYNNGGVGVAYDTDVQVKVVASGATHSLYVTLPGEEYGDPIYTYTEESQLYTAGYVGFMQWHGTESEQVSTAFDNLEIESHKEDVYEVDGYSLSLAEGISVNFATDAAFITEKGYTDPVATFKINNLTFTAEGKDNGNGKYIFTLSNVRPDWMGEDITIVLSAVVNGEKVTSEPATYTVANYCYTLLRSGYASETLKTLLVDILNYGAAAQVYAEHEGVAVNADLTAEELAYGTDGDPICVSDKALALQDGVDEKANWKSIALYLRETIRLRGCFTSSVSDSLFVEITDLNGNVLGTIDQTEMVYEGGQYSFFYDGVKASEMRLPIKMTICSGDAAISKTLTYSVESYAANEIDNGYDQDLIDLMKAMMRYGDAAIAYNMNPWEPSEDDVTADSWGIASEKKETPIGTKYVNLFADNASVLETQVGYSKYGYKAVYVRSTVNPGVGNYYADFSLISADSNETVYTGKATYWGQQWDSYWWVADFSDFQTDGRYFVNIENSGSGLSSQTFAIDADVLTDSTLQIVLFSQLDARRSEGKLGWRDSSTDHIRELQSNTAALETLCDVYDAMYESLSAEDQAKLVDNIYFGCEYLLALQEKTDDPLTNGRFKHDLYETEFSAPLVRNLYDTFTAMATLARCYGIMKDHDPDVAQTYKEAFELSYALCVLRPYYLDSEFTLETDQGYSYTTAAARTYYDISSMSWNFPTTLRTRDRLMYMRACTEMYKSTQNTTYMEQATILADQIADRQYTDYQSTVDGCYGMFREFDNNESAFMIDWLQGFGQNLGCILPTDLEPFMDLIRYNPQSPDAARWYNVIHTFAEGYVKNSAELTALGIYPVGAYSDETNGGIKFFQPLTHGANNLYGHMGRNMTILGDFLQDAKLQELAQRNTQFIVGLNPGIPNAYEATSWKATSFIYGIGESYFKPSHFYEDITPYGSVANGFSAAPQFTEQTISQNKDLPVGILNSDGSYQYNEDYLPHAMGYMSAAVLTEIKYCLTVNTFCDGNATAGTITAMIDGEVYKTYTISNTGTLTITDLPLGETVTLVASDGNGITTQRTIGVVGGGSNVWNVDFASLVRVQLYAPEVITEQSRTGAVVLQNKGNETVTVTLKLIVDGITVNWNHITKQLAPGEKVTIPVEIISSGIVKPYVLIALAGHTNYTTAAILNGFAQ